MANLLVDASKWVDDAGGSPPSYWSGTAYDFLTGYQYPGASIRYTGEVKAGDVVSFALVNRSGPMGGPASNCGIYINNTLVVSQGLWEVGTYTLTSPALAAGDSVIIGFSPFSYPTEASYAMDCSIVPIGENAFWTDFVGCIEV